MCGVEQQAIQQRCLSLKIDVKQGISDENAALLVTYYAIEKLAESKVIGLPQIEEVKNFIAGG